MTAATVDLLELIGRDVALRKAAATHGGEYVGACPFCGGQDKRAADRFHVWPETGRYWCRRCDRKGDAIEYVREREHLSFPDALARLGLADDHRAGAGGSSPSAARVLLPRHDPAYPPPEDWQAAAIEFCNRAIAHLWGPEGERALTWLRDVRGLTDETITAASLGYNPNDEYAERAAWGLPPEEGEHGRPRRVWLPRGVVIPWTIRGDLWRVNVRRPLTVAQQAAGEAKYVAPTGSGPGLYWADTLASDWPAVLVEGELDALTLYQHAGGLASPVATGGTGGAQRVKWLAELATCGRVLVAFDNDKAGEDKAGYWLKVLSNARRWRVFYGKDLNEFAQLGGDLRAWVYAGIMAE